jgi:rhodanese-related sulfurtransferase
MSWSRAHWRGGRQVAGCSQAPFRFNGWMKTSLALSCAALLLTVSAAFTAEAPTVTNVTPDEAAKLLQDKPDVVVLDIRTEDEFKEGHIAGAKNIDYQGADFAKSVAALEKDKTYLVHCASGGRSTKSLKVFADQKFEKILHLDAGFKGWQAAGKPVEK